MIAVVADTSPLNYLIQIDCHKVLPILYRRILLPDVVAKELDQRGTPPVVRAWMQQVPQWVEVRKIGSRADSTLSMLDPGEREAIQLAEEIGSDLLLMDDRAGVRIARGRGLLVTGTLGVLTLPLLDIDHAITLLEATDFRCKPELFEQA